MGRKLSEQDLERYRALLVHLVRQLSGDIDSLEVDAFSTGDERRSVDDPADTGTDSFAREFNLELLQRDESTLAEIDKALERIDAGTYGRCESCSQWLRKGRLNAVPHARKCVDCQRRAESKD